MGPIAELMLLFYLPMFVIPSVIFMLIVFGPKGFAVFSWKVGLIILSAIAFAFCISFFRSL